MLILILINVNYSQKTVFSCEKGSNDQNRYYSGSYYPTKKYPLSNIFDSPNPLLLFEKSCNVHR